jgi:hypothetical protein
MGRGTANERAEGAQFTSQPDHDVMDNATATFRPHTIPPCPRVPTRLKLDVLVLQRFHVEPNRRHGRDGLVNLQAVCSVPSAAAGER